MKKEELLPKNESECIDCKSKVPYGARKCLTCGSRQDWRRFLDFGNTSATLVIAAMSVLALGSQHLISVYDWFADSERGGLSVKITSVNSDRISLFVDNDGPGSVVFNQSALCSIWPTHKSSTLWTFGRPGEPKVMQTRYPTSEEVVGRYVYFYGQDNPIILKPGFQQIFNLRRRKGIITEGKELLASSEAVKSYCTFSFLHENTSEDGIMEILDSLSVSFFALERTDVQEALKESQSPD